MNPLWPYKKNRLVPLRTYELCIDTNDVRRIAKEIRHAAHAGRLTGGINGKPPRRFLVSYNLETHHIGGLEVVGHVSLKSTPQNVFLYFTSGVGAQELILLIRYAIARMRRNQAQTDA